MLATIPTPNRGYGRRRRCSGIPDRPCARASRWYRGAGNRPRGPPRRSGPARRRVVARFPSSASLSHGKASMVFLSQRNRVGIDARGWSRDGQSLFFTYGTPVDPHIGVLSMAMDENAKRSWKRFIERPGGALAGPIAPDGQWIVTES